MPANPHLHANNVSPLCNGAKQIKVKNGSKEAAARVVFLIFPSPLPASQFHMAASLHSAAVRPRSPVPHTLAIYLTTY